MDEKLSCKTIKIQMQREGEGGGGEANETKEKKEENSFVIKAGTTIDMDKTQRERETK